jgi:putative transcriptional regulator
MSLTQNIKLLREEKNLSQAAVAEYLGMSRPSYDKVETGEKDLTVPEATKLAEILGVTFEDLFRDTIHEKAKGYNPKRYREMIARLIKLAGDNSDGRITKTKLAKLLYLADFSWFYDNLESISGLQYRRITQGPVPDEYFRVIDEMYENGDIDIKFSGKAMMISLNEDIDETQESRLTDDQRSLIESVASEWESARTDSIVKYTHTQLPWRLCKDGEIIPYELIIQEDPDNVYRRPVSSRVN